MAKKIDINVQSNLNALKARLKAQATQLANNEVVAIEDDMFWYGPPVSPKEFIESTEYFGDKQKK